MWSVNTERLANTNGLRVKWFQESLPATVAEVIKAFESQSEFRSLFNAFLADSPFKAFRWESPAITTNTLTNPFECVLLDCPELIREPNPKAFQEFFSTTDDSVAVFPNLGRDAILIVPKPTAESSRYCHLSDFVRTAPDNQIHALWQTVGKAMSQRVGLKPVWLNTAGAGVPWLHIRLDDRPKYYFFKEYKTI